MVTVQAPRLFVSHTQIDSAANAETGCLRRWKFKWIDKLPEPIRGTQEFGDVAHKVCERWLRADDLGRDANGNAVDLYPEGWAKGDSGVELSPADQDLIRRLISAAIEKGVLRRTPGRQVELPFEIPLSDEVVLTGRIDLAAPGEVTDHKFLKSLRYLMSPAKLRESGQHLLYVLAMTYLLKQKKQVVPQEWTLAVNGFSKDPDDFRVKRVEVKVPLEAAFEWRDRVLKPTFEKMMALKNMVPPIPVENWREIDDPINKNAACGAYGGCAFQGICGGLETVKAHLHRVKKFNEKVVAKATQQPLRLQEGTSDMGSAFDKLRNRGQGQASGNPAAPSVVMEAPPPPVKAPRAEQPAPPQEQLEAEADTPAPWGFKDCTVESCKGKGFNARGNPCRLCSGRAEKERGIFLKDYAWKAVGEGKIVWSSNDGENDGLVTIGPVGEAKVKEVAPPAPAPAPVLSKKVLDPELAIVAHVEEAQEVEEQTEEDEPEAKKRNPGRPKQGLTLYVNCVPTRGHKTKLAYLTEVMHAYGERAAVESKACPEGTEGAFYMMDAFKRRDFLASRAKTIAEQLGSVNLVCRTGPDEDRLIAALSAIEGVKVVEALR